MSERSSEFMGKFNRLGTDNYSVWAIRMRGLLVQAGVWDAVHVVIEQGASAPADAGASNGKDNEKAFHLTPSSCTFHCNPAIESRSFSFAIPV
jgi:hypothetical protein